MPDWCECRLRIVGTEESLTHFRDGLTSSSKEAPTLLQTYLPVPAVFEKIHCGFARLPDRRKITTWRESATNQRDSVRELIPIPLAEQLAIRWKYGATRRSDWCLKNWGTKWGDSETKLVEDLPAQGILTYHFLTPSQPPLRGVLGLSRLFSALIFHLTYHEPMRCIRGIYCCKEGTRVCEWRTSYEPPTSVAESPFLSLPF